MLHFQRREMELSKFDKVLNKIIIQTKTFVFFHEEKIFPWPLILPHPPHFPPPPPFFFLPHKGLYLFFIIMSVVESIFDKAAFYGGVSKYQLLANWKVISFATTYMQELLQELF